MQQDSERDISLAQSYVKYNCKNFGRRTEGDSVRSPRRIPLKYHRTNGGKL